MAACSTLWKQQLQGVRRSVFISRTQRISEQKKAADTGNLRARTPLP